MAAIIVGAAVVRFATLGVESLWLDEAVTFGNISGSLGHVFTRVRTVERTPPGYYLVLWEWARVFGRTTVAVRALSALVGTLTVPVAYALARRLLDRPAALAVALLTAVNPMLVYFSQEARAYSLMVFLCALSLLAFVWAKADPRPRRLAAWAVPSMLALTVHYFSFFFVAPEAVLLLYAVRDHRRAAVPILAAVAAVAATGAALLPLLLEQTAGGGSEGQFPATTTLSHRVIVTAKQFLVGPTGPHPALMSAIAGAFVLVAVLLLARYGTQRERRQAALMGALGLAVIILPVLLALGGKDYYYESYVLPAWLPFAIVAAAGFSTVGGRRIGVVALAGSCALSLTLIAITVANVRYQRDDWLGVSQALGIATRPRAIAVVSEGNGVEPLELYRPAARVWSPRDPRVSELDVVAIANRVPGGAGPAPAVPPLSPRSGWILQSSKIGATFTVRQYFARSPRMAGDGVSLPYTGSVLFEPEGARPGQP